MFCKKRGREPYIPYIDTLTPVQISTTLQVPGEPRHSHRPCHRHPTLPRGDQCRGTCPCPGGPVPGGLPQYPGGLPLLHPSYPAPPMPLPLSPCHCHHTSTTSQSTPLSMPLSPVPRHCYQPCHCFRYHINVAVSMHLRSSVSNVQRRVPGNQCHPLDSIPCLVCVQHRALQILVTVCAVAVTVAVPSGVTVAVLEVSLLVSLWLCRWLRCGCAAGVAVATLLASLWLCCGVAGGVARGCYGGSLRCPGGGLYRVLYRSPDSGNTVTVAWKRCVVGDVAVTEAVTGAVTGVLGLRSVVAR